MATASRREYPRYGELLDAVYRARDWWRTIYILERVLVFLSALFALVFALTLLEAHLHLSAALRWPLCVLLLGYFAAGMALLVFRPLFRDWPEEQVAVHIERKYPELDNRLINALQLGVDDRVASPGMVEMLVTQTAREIEAYPVRESVATRRARYLAGTAFFSLALLATWAGLSFDRFFNAFQRLLLPASQIAALGKVRILDVEPKDISLNSGSALEVLVTTEGGTGGELDAVLIYRYQDSDEKLTKAMSPLKSNLYVCRVEDVKAPLRYQANIGGTESETYEVTVVEPPVIIQRDVAYDFPTFTGWEDRTDEDTNGDVKAPIDTLVTLRFATNKAVQSGHIQLSSGAREKLSIVPDSDDRRLEARLSIQQEGTYTIRLTDRDGISRDSRESKITALQDQAPQLEFRTPAKDITTALGSQVKLGLMAKDDYGVSVVRLFARVVRDGQDGAQRVIKTWTEFANPRRVPLALAWDLASPEYAYKVGDEIVYYAVARDNHAEVREGGETPKPQESKTDEFKITIQDKEQVAKAKTDAISNWETELRKVLETQLDAREAVAALGQEEDIAGLHQAGRELAKAQTDIFTRTLAIANGIKPADEQSQGIKDSITFLAYGEMTRCVKLVQGVSRLEELKILKETYAAVAASQDKIIQVLRRLLNVLPEIAEDINKDALDDEDVEDFPDEDEEAMKDLLRNLKEMMRDQKKAIETTDELAKMPVDDYTPDEEKKLEDVKAIEEKWSQFLKATISDLSKMQEQDFANPTLINELIEIHSEIEMAKDALGQKATEIATALEDNGLMLAEKLTKQLEKWLPDTPDRDRWQMEEPLTDGYETPMAELPKELEDIVGDLMEEEEDLQQEIEDATSAWADSMDAAGWDAMDGPISNFAANGVTGNRLPNTSELSGRSAEGRQGKSVGEFVEDQFDGKGGRRTPTRLTSEDFQKGQIKDTSSTPPGGATGGGKAGGSSGEGLEGPVPPDIQMKMKGFAMKQAQIRNKAEQIALKFEVLNTQPVFEPLIKNMHVLEAALNSGRYVDARRQHNVLLKNLKGTRLFVEGEISLEQVRSPTLPAHLQEEIIDTAGAAVPEQFKEYVKGYYEAISKAR